MLAAFVAALMLKTFAVDFMVAEGRSMTPTIAPGTIIIVNKAAYGLRIPFSPGYVFRWRLPRAGDIVVFPSPAGRLAVKRCAFSEGIPAGHFSAFGDNSVESYDSRNYGPVPLDAVLGKVVGIR